MIVYVVVCTPCSHSEEYSSEWTADFQASTHDDFMHNKQKTAKVVKRKK